MIRSVEAADRRWSGGSSARDRCSRRSVRVQRLASPARPQARTRGRRSRNGRPRRTSNARHGDARNRGPRRAPPGPRRRPLRLPRRRAAHGRATPTPRPPGRATEGTALRSISGAWNDSSLSTCWKVNTRQRVRMTSAGEPRRDRFWRPLQAPYYVPTCSESLQKAMDFQG